MAAFLKNVLILKLIFVQFSIHILCFNVKFKNFYDAEVEPFNTQVFKREMTQFFDKASYSFNGFKKVESIPVIFPIDICILKLEHVKYATSLYRNPAGERHFAVFKMNNGSYTTIADIPTPKAIAMDCIGVGNKGYITVAFNFSSPVENAREGSPIYQLENDRLHAIQYFSNANLNNIYLRVQGNNIMVLQSFRNTKSIPNLFCPYFSWSGSTFNPVGRIPCSNARHLEPFSIEHENYVAVANYADQRGRTSTYSEIYKFIKEKKKFQLHQKIKTNGAVDVRFFRVPIDEFRYQYFLVFGNSLSNKNSLNTESKKNTENNYEADSIFYIYDKGQFVPYQRLTLYAVEQFLPIQNVDAEKFLLLVSSKNQDIKIYNLNDWKFEESTAQFTEGALGKGVARMRIFQEHEESYLVIANELMAANETNIFSPIFKQEEHANALRQQIIDWSKVNMKRLKQINVERLKNDVERKLLMQQKEQTKTSLKSGQIPKANIETVVTQSLIYPQLHINSNYWKALDFANQALNALEQHAPHKPRKRELRTDIKETEYDFEHVQVETLFVHINLSTKNINGIVNSNPVFTTIKAQNVIVTGKYTAPKVEERVMDLDNLVNIQEPSNALTVQDLIVNGKINGFSWHQLLSNTIKNTGSQSLTTNASFGNLNAESTNVESNEIKGWDLRKLVLINGGDIVVKHNVLFVEPMIANEVIIETRLNQIVMNGNNFGALIKRSNTTQVLTGEHRFNNLRVLQPITLTSKISSNHLREIIPLKEINENLVLEGDYVINGDVTIAKLLHTEDFVHAKTNLSAGISLSNGLLTDEPLEDVNIVFESAIKANSSIVSFVNSQDMQQLIKTNTNDPQVVSGLKVFKNGLNIENGLSEVKVLNGFDVENLEQQILTKNTNQTIEAPMHFQKILARGIFSPKFILNNRSLATFLTKSGNQQINGTLKVNKLEVETHKVKNLNTNGKIFDQQLSDILQHKSKTVPTADVFHKNQKFLGTVYVKNLKINASLNEKTIEELESLLTQLNGNIKFVGNFKINYNMDVENLTFHGQFNGIDAKDFGSCWLTKSGEQTFTATQTFASVEFEEGATLAGKLNGFAVKDFIENTYWIDRAEFIRDVIFQNPIELQMPLDTLTLNKLFVPSDMLYRSTEQPQILEVPISIQENLRIQGSIRNTTVINDIPLEKLERYLIYSEMKSTLFLENANFSYTPTYRTLNKYNLQKTLDTVWLANEDIELKDHVEISESSFEGLLDFTGPINNINLKYVKENYLSKSIPQVISMETIFTEKVSFKSDVQADNVELTGSLVEAESQSSMNFNEFVLNSLKRKGEQDIYGNWTILKASIAGDIYNVAVNNLNLAADVVRSNGNNVITTKKSIFTTSIEKVYTKEGSTINNVDVSKWIRYAVYIDKNQTVYGLTTLDNANIQDLAVAGYINNIFFDEHHLLLNDQQQTVYGNFKLRNKFPMEQRILANNIKSLYTKKINEFEVDNFLNNLTKLTNEDTLQERTLNTHLVFEQPLFVNEYACDNDKNIPKRKRHTLVGTSSEGLTSRDMDILEELTRNLSMAVKDTEAILYDFELTQVLPINATKLIPLTIRQNNEIISVIGFIDESKQQGAVKFYYWSKEKMLFIPNDTSLSWLPQDPSALEMIKLIFGSDYLTLQRPQSGELFKKNIISGNGFKEMLNFTHKGQLMEPLKFKGKDCFAVYRGSNSKTIVVYCLYLSEENAFLNLNKEYEIKKNAQQVLAFSETQIAILVENTIEIWNNSGELRLHQILKTINKAKQIAIGKLDQKTYLAVITTNNLSNLISATVQIYSAINTYFTYQQTLDLDVEPRQIVFNFLEASQDLLLHVRTSAADKPLLIYQYKGVMGFQRISGAKTLLEATNHMQIVDVKASNKQFLVLFRYDGTISFLNFKLKLI